MYVDLVVFALGCMFVEMDEESLRFIKAYQSLT